MTASARTWGLALGLLLLGCSDTEPEGPGGDGLPARRLVTADFLEGTLSVLDYDKVIAGPGALADVRVKSIALTGYSPGPLQLELTPDGSTALVAVGPGFYETLGPVFGFPAVQGDGALLVVNINAESVDAVSTRHVPMGVAISPDGSQGFSANFGHRSAPGSSLTRIDLGSKSVLEEVEVGGGPEQVRLFDAELGMLNVASEGSVRRFDPRDITGTLGPLVPTSADPSDIAFLSAEAAVVVDSRNDAGYSVLELTSAGGLSVKEQHTLAEGIPYGIARIPETEQVLVGIATGTPALLLRIDVGSSPSQELARYDLGNTQGSFALNVAVSPDGSYAFVAIPVENRLAVVELASGSVHHISGWTNAAPTYADVWFPPGQ